MAVTISAELGYPLFLFVVYFRANQMGSGKNFPLKLFQVLIPAYGNLRNLVEFSLRRFLFHIVEYLSDTCIVRKMATRNKLVFRSCFLR